MNPLAADGRAGYVNVTRRDGIQAMDGVQAMDRRCFTCDRKGHLAKDCTVRDRNQKPTKSGDKKFPARNAGGAKVRFSAKKRNKIIAALDAVDSDEDQEEEDEDQDNSDDEAEQEEETPPAGAGQEQDFS
jgi:hypothetical protein